MELLRVKQHLESNPISDVEAEVFRQLDGLQMDVPQGPIAITAGSRGIDQIAAIVTAAGKWLKDHGADPFVVPTMGSHNGATAEGQQSMVESLGMREADTGLPIRSSMECVKVGEVATGDVWMDRHCYESAGVLVVNRVKLHTCFSGPIQSGLTKMMVVGMGKIRSAQTFHSANAVDMKNMLIEMGQFLIDSGKIFAGLAILEDGFDQTAELHALRPQDILVREPGLLDKHREYFPTLPIHELNTLVVQEMGKTFSGTGMDTNVLGFRGVPQCEDLTRPNIQIVAALRLAAASQGNALGVGLADFITQPLRDAIDERKTFINVLTTGDMRRGAIPATLPNDRTLIQTIRERFGEQRWMFIPNTLHLGALYASTDLHDELEAHPRCEVQGTTTLEFDGDELALEF